MLAEKFDEFKLYSLFTLLERDANYKKKKNFKQILSEFSKYQFNMKWLNIMHQSLSSYFNGSNKNVSLPQL